MPLVQPGYKITPHSNRLLPLDGLRAVAALGVLWIHCWSFYGAPRLTILGVDVTSLMALGGNGVDLFFVISGFCMYYFYVRNTYFNYLDFLNFIKKRWQRLSPAFYTACGVYILLQVYSDPSFPVAENILTSLFYLNGVSPFTPQSILWTLTTEWEFYLIIPFLLIYQNRIGFNTIFWAIGSVFFVTAILTAVVLKEKADILTGQIVFRYPQFMCGVFAARMFLLYPFPQLKNRGLYFIGFVVLTYSGRILISQIFLNFSPEYYSIFKLLGFTFMGMGFSGILYIVITSQRYLKKIFGGSLISFIGRISFSFYLWHALIHQAIGEQLLKIMGTTAGITVPLINFAASTVILIPISAVSFRLLENGFPIRKNLK